MRSTAGSSDEGRVPTLREVVTPIFRYKLAGLSVAGLVMAVTLLFIVFDAPHLRGGDEVPC